MSASTRASASKNTAATENGNWLTARRVRQAALLVVAGLLVEALTLTSARAATFVSFIFVSGTLMALGALWFLWAVWRDWRLGTGGSAGSADD